MVWLKFLTLAALSTVLFKGISICCGWEDNPKFNRLITVLLGGLVAGEFCLVGGALLMRFS